MKFAKRNMLQDYGFLKGRKKPKETLEQEMRFLLAVKLFELRRLSLGKAAELSGMKKSSFMDEMGRMGIPVIKLDNDQIRDELKNA